ncbi:DUF2510 domain-containing protein [Sanguibacter suaedae]|uniref:DUF2510 domain-containing protein n=1 Tax=Sanguibacter suaedae TaxID=2795737 RepID=A0A934I8R4_9MICO|nr:DUF2510 domain-containing protein [Sanguibacter suaedae]MBI9113481.1 DUF2510 domain-containing protein [Sanguibacter suaedae]
MSAPAGWYPDPQQPQQLRYFDGAAWTVHTQPAPGAAPAQDASGGQAQGAGAGYGQAGYAAQGGYAKQPHQSASYAAHHGAYGAGAQQQQEPEQPQGGVGLFIVGGLVAIAVVVGIGIWAGAGEPAEGAVAEDVADLFDEGYGCEELVEDFVYVFADDPDESRLVAVEGVELVEDNLSTVERPTGSAEPAVIIECRGEGEWADGTTQSVDLVATLDAAGEVYLRYR